MKEVIFVEDSIMKHSPQVMTLLSRLVKSNSSARHAELYSPICNYIRRIITEIVCKSRRD